MSATLARTCRRNWAWALLAVSTAQAAPVSDGAQLTLYRSDEASLFEGESRTDPAGYALVHATRVIQLQAGTQTLRLDGLPTGLLPESLNLRVTGAAARIDAQSVQSADSSPEALLGTHVEVLGSQGQRLAQGQLLRAGDPLLLRLDDGSSVWLRDYAMLRSQRPLSAQGTVLQMRVTAAHAGAARLIFDYATRGLAWRANYQALVTSTAGRCRVHWRSQASIANRSGLSWPAGSLRLIAGTPPQEQAPMPMPRFQLAMDAPARFPAASAVGDKRQYRLSEPLALPADSLTLVPLYPDRDEACQQVAWLDDGLRPWYGSKPQLDAGDSPAPDERLPVSRQLKLRAGENLPAGTVQVLLGGGESAATVLGNGHLPDTPAGQPVMVALGNIFDLSAQRQRTGFTLNRARHQLDERFRLSLENAGDSAYQVTIREHPSHWRQWRLLASSSAPAMRDSDHLDFRLTVPAHGHAVLDYTVRYQWQAADE